MRSSGCDIVSSSEMIRLLFNSMFSSELKITRGAIVLSESGNCADNTLCPKIHRSIKHLRRHILGILKGNFYNNRAKFTLVVLNCPKTLFYIFYASYVFQGLHNQKNETSVKGS